MLLSVHRKVIIELHSLSRESYEICFYPSGNLFNFIGVLTAIKQRFCLIGYNTASQEERCTASDDNVLSFSSPVRLLPRMSSRGRLITTWERFYITAKADCRHRVGDFFDVIKSACPAGETISRAVFVKFQQVSESWVSVGKMSQCCIETISNRQEGSIDPHCCFIHYAGVNHFS